MNKILIDNAKVMSKGQVTIPKEIRDRLAITTGDRITFICEGDKVTMMNAAVYAMKMLQSGMMGEAQNVGIENEDDVVNMVKEIRKDKN